MPLDHSNVTASVSITGLALGRYNVETNNYEVGFIRDLKHLLTITVLRHGADNTVSTMTFELDKRHRIFIETHGGLAPPERFYKPTENFDRNAEGQDREDFQWIMDLQKDLNQGQDPQLKKPELPVTETYISRPMLYADPTGFASGPVKKVNVADPNDATPFGELCETIKGDIRCENGGAVILRIEGPLGFTLPPLEYIPGQTHEIVMKNLCPTPAAAGPAGGSASDFIVYYSVIEDTAGQRFNLQLENPDVHNPDGVCNGSNFGSEGALFPLPS